MPPRTAIPLVDLKAHHSPLRAALIEAFERVLDGGSFILGPEVQAFEDEVAAMLGVEHAIGVSNGSDALLLSLLALQVGPGDEVITTPFSFFATASAIVRAGARPVFVDIEADTFNIDASQIRSALSPHTRAIVAVHLFGQPADVPALREICDSAGVALVEDAAQAILATRAGVKVGSCGDAACFSFFPSKNLGALGDAGLVTTRSGELAARVRALRVHGAKVKYHHDEIGGNYRLDALQAALLRVKLPYLPMYTASRQRHAASYDQLFSTAGLAAWLAHPARRADGHVYHQYTIRCDYRDLLREHLKSQQIGCEVYYPVPLHLQPCFRYLGYQPGSFPEAERAARQVLSLPIYPELTTADLRHVVSEVIRFHRWQADYVQES